MNAALLHGHLLICVHMIVLLFRSVKTQIINKSKVSEFFHEKE